MILLVEDDKKISEALTDFLSSEGFHIEVVSKKAEAVSAIAKSQYELLIVDISLPDGNGFEVCQKANEKKLPVIFLTASGDERSVVKGFDYGAYDYISKPFRPLELLSRIKSVLRRTGTQSMVTIENLSVDTDKGVVTKNGSQIDLSALEYRLLILFLNHRGILLSRNKLLEDIWDIAGDYVNDNTLTVYIKRLREKIEDDPQKPTIIKTIRGMGYRMD